VKGDTYSNDRGFSDLGGWSLGNADPGLADTLANGSTFGGGEGGRAMEDRSVSALPVDPAQNQPPA
jgi:hypothetical protein